VHSVTQTQPPISESALVAPGAATAQNTITPMINAQTNVNFEKLKTFITNFLSMIIIPKNINKSTQKKNNPYFFNNYLPIGPTPFRK
jgi:hypothetical protein